MTLGKPSDLQLSISPSVKGDVDNTFLMRLLFQLDEDQEQKEHNIQKLLMLIIIIINGRGTPTGRGSLKVETRIPSWKA